MNFDSLYEMIEILNESTNEKCLICHLPIENDELILSCNHYYHSKCLNKKTIKIKCYYCAKIVTEKKKEKNKNIKNITNITNECKVLLLTGIRKGEYCGRNNCYYHKLNKEIINVIDSKNVIESVNIITSISPNNLCNVILKTGLRKGNICNRNNCKFHTINL